MNTQVNNYTIDDFLKLKPVIYEYCVNLTQKKTTTSWFRDFADADDLYQEVFLYIHDNFFNKPIEPMGESKFTQIMKNYTYWTYQRRFSRKGAKLYRSLNRIDDSPKDLFLFEESHWESPTGYVDFRESIDFAFYTKNLKPLELTMLNMYLDGFLIKEIDEFANRYRGYFENVLRKKLLRFVNNDVKKVRKEVKPVVLEKDDSAFLQTKVNNFSEVFNFQKANSKYIRIYSLYLQKVTHTDIASEFKCSNNQIASEIHRIKQKIKRYE